TRPARAWACRSCAGSASGSIGRSGWTARPAPVPRRRSSSPATSSRAGIPEGCPSREPPAAGACQPDSHPRVVRVDTLPVTSFRMSQPRSKSTSSRNKRRLLGVVVVAALVALAAWYWLSHRAAADEGQWRTATVEGGDIRVAISATGTLSAISTVTVGSQVSGQVTEVLVDFNDKVVKDQVIARIDPSTYEAQINQGNAQVASAQASLKQAQATL